MVAGEVDMAMHATVLKKKEKAAAVQAPAAYPVIMCGGAGSRLWPASRPSRPKQFMNLFGSSTLFEETIDRVRSIAGFSELIVVTGHSQHHWVAKQLRSAGLKATVLLEPEPRDSAPAIAVAAAYVRSLDPEGVMVVVASDHHIPDADMFRWEIDHAIKESRRGGIVTLGIMPTEPSSAYGYIKPRSGNERITGVDSFVEKPDVETAAGYIRNGYMWNSGNFIAGATTLMDEFHTHAPEVARAAEEALNEVVRVDEALLLGPSFRTAPRISIDYAIMENCSDTKVLRSKLTWSDLGAWDAIHRVGTQDAAGNVVSGDVHIGNSTNSLVRAVPGKFAAVTGVDGLSVVVEDDAVLVTPLDNSQSVKGVVDWLKTVERPEVDIPKRVFQSAGAAQSLTNWFFNAALPLWWSAGFDYDRKTWRESLTLATATPTRADRRARVQGRQAYVYALAEEMGWQGPGHMAATQTFTGVKRRFTNEKGLLKTLMDDEGTIIDSTTLLYDQTFMLLALAGAAPFLEDAHQRALQLLDVIDSQFSRPDNVPGYREKGASPFQSNAHMHLFEACMAWAMQEGTSHRWRETAGHIAVLAADRFVDGESRFLREYFNDRWAGARGERGRVVEPGHQFEWAWLFSRWTRFTGDRDFLDLARRLYDAGRCGVDAARGVVVDKMDDTLTQTTKQARLWHQTEWLKAAIVLAEDHEGSRKDAYAGDVESAWSAVSRYLATDIKGLWRDKMLEDGSFVEEAVPASTFYHLATALVELRRYAGLPFKVSRTAGAEALRETTA